MPRRHDTVVAVATPCGLSALGIVRLSGPAAIEIVDRVYTGRRLAGVPSQTVHRGKITDPLDHRSIDDVLVTVFRTPNSYTGEDLVEISCHGNPLVLDLVVQTCISAGARLAQPGEFTRRALENGKLDLIQAEAVLDLVTAPGEWARQNALGQLEGRFSTEVRQMTDGVAECLAQIEAGLDFPEDADWSDLAALRTRIEKVSATLDRLLEGAKEGFALREGPRVVIVGRPNVGKSRLFNCLVGQERVIVTDTPGTTRDYIEEMIRIEDRHFRIVDTAGLGWDEDRIAGLGMEKTAWLVNQADLLLVVFDLAEPARQEDQAVAAKTEGKRRLMVGNKVDRPRRFDASVLSGSAVEVSALTGAGVDLLRQAILGQFANPTPRAGSVVTNRRQIDVLNRTRETLGRARGLDQYETIAVELRVALDALGELVGRCTSEDILEKIFTQFCIGK